MIVIVKVPTSYATFKYDLRLRRSKRHEEKNDIRIADSRALGRNAGRKLRYSSSRGKSI